MVRPERMDYFLELHKIIFDYLKEELGVTEKDKLFFSDRVISIALFVRRTEKELLEFLKKHARDK